MQIVALNWQLYLITHSPVALGFIGLTRFIPVILFSLIGGSVADSFNRKKIQIVCQIILAVTAIMLFITTINHTINPPIIFILTAIAAALLSFDLPARQAMVPSLVEKSAFQNAMSINSIQFHTATILGPVIAGFLIANTGTSSVYLFNAISYVVFAFILFSIKASGDPGGEESDVSISHIKEGLSFIKSKTIVWSTMLLDSFCTFFASASALLPIFAKDILHVGPQGLGLLYAADAIGAVTAGFAVAHMGGIRKQGKVLLISVVFYALGTIIFGFSKIYLISLLGLIIVGLGDGVSVIIRNTVRQIATPDNLRGRMTSINMIFFLGGPQLGEFEAGLLAGIIGAPLSVVAGGVGTLIVIAVMAWKIPKLRQYENKISEPAY